MEDADNPLEKAFAHHQAGQLDRALPLYEQCLAHQPQNPDPWHLLGLIHYAQANYSAARQCIQQALSLAPERPEILSNLGLCFHATGAFDAAVEAYQHALRIKPDYPEAYYNLANTYRDLRQMTEAQTAYEQALSLAPDNPDPRCNLADVLIQQGDLMTAEIQLTQLLSIHPDHALAHFNLGQCYQQRAAFDQAEAAYDHAIALNNVPDAQFAKAQLHLLQGELDWAGYECRWQCPQLNLGLRTWPFPRWQGEALTGKTLLVWGEQGIGDEIFFARSLSELLATGVRCTIECDPRLIPLYKRSFPDLHCIPRTEPSSLTGAFDYHCPIGSLLARFTKPIKSSYLIPDSQRVAHFRERYVTTSTDRLVGISWQSHNARFGQQRTIPLEHWIPLLQQPGQVIVSLQYQPNVAEIQRAEKQSGRSIIQDPEIDPLHAIDDLAAQIAAMDQVMTIDNATAHLAGALAVKTICLLPPVPDWRWGLKSDRTPWYPTLRLCRQIAPRHCEKHSDEAIQKRHLDCFVAMLLAMTGE